jgi:hypothetical protein
MTAPDMEVVLLAMEDARRIRGDCCGNATMTKDKAIIGQDRIKWRVGRRVSRKNSEEEGTIVEADDRIKVKWDSGKTSYYDRKTPASVQLMPRNGSSGH